MYKTNSSELLAKNTIINLVGMIIPLFIGVIAIPFAINGLGVEGFGVLSIIWVILSYFLLLDFGLSRASSKFIAENIHLKNVESIPILFWTSTLISLVLGIFGSILLYLISSLLVLKVFNVSPGQTVVAIQSLRIIALAIPFILVSINLKGILGSIQRFDLVNIVNVPTNALNFIIPALTKLLGISLQTAIWLIVLTRIIAFFIYFHFSFKVFPVSENFSFDLKIIRKLISYGGWISITCIIAPLLTYTDRFFIGSLTSVTLLTYYVAPVDALTRLRVLPMALMTTFFPEFSKGLYDDNKQRIMILFFKASKYIFIAMGLLSLLLFNLSDIILDIWLGTEFMLKSNVLFKIFSISIFINFIALVPFTFLQGIGKPDLPAKINLFELPFYVIITYLCTKYYGLNGTALCWFSRVLIDCLLLYFWSFKYVPQLKKYYHQYSVLKLIFLLSVTAILLFTINNLILNIYWRIVLSLICSLIVVLIIWKYLIDTSDKEIIERVFCVSIRKSS